jgi:hypothetical protein
MTDIATPAWRAANGRGQLNDELSEVVILSQLVVEQVPALKMGPRYGPSPVAHLSSNSEPLSTSYHLAPASQRSARPSIAIASISPGRRRVLLLLLLLLLLIPPTRTGSSDSSSLAGMCSATELRRGGEDDEAGGGLI